MDPLISARAVHRESFDRWAPILIFLPAYRDGGPDTRPDDPLVRGVLAKEADHTRRQFR